MTEIHTSDQRPRPNVRTREDWLAAVLSGQTVTRISQHLALVLYHLADPATGVAKRSLRELETITGWGRSTIADHLSELEIFMRVELGKGRGKNTFELECSITEAIRKQRVVANQSDTTAANDAALVASRPGANPVVANQPDATARSVVANQPDATVVASEPDAIPDNTPDTTVVANQPDATPDTTAPSRTYARANRESPSEIVISKPDSLSRSVEQEAAEEPSESSVKVNGVAIYGPGFKLSFAAIDMAASLIGMAADRARQIATICAHDWADNKRKPDNPMAVIKKALKADLNDAAIHDVRMQKAAAGPQRQTNTTAPAEATSRRARLAKWADEIDDSKGSRK